MKGSPCCRMGGGMLRGAHQLPLHSLHACRKPLSPPTALLGSALQTGGRCPSSWPPAPGSQGNSTVTALMEYKVHYLMASSSYSL